jgi:hypothetical protein
VGHEGGHHLVDQHPAPHQHHSQVTQPHHLHITGMHRFSTINNKATSLRDKEHRGQI